MRNEEGKRDGGEGRGRRRGEREGEVPNRTTTTPGGMGRMVLLDLTDA